MSTVPIKPPDFILDAIRKRYSYWDGHLIDNEGTIVGARSKGYMVITFRVEGIQHTARIHHVIWYLCKGEWPTQELDHKDQNKSNNLIGNLEYSNRRKQAINSCLHNKKYDLPLGVSIKQSGLYDQYTRYVASIRINGKSKHLGYFSNPEDAHNAYLAKYKELHGEPLCVTV